MHALLAFGSMSCVSPPSHTTARKEWASFAVGGCQSVSQARATRRRGANRASQNSPRSTLKAIPILQRGMDCLLLRNDMHSCFNPAVGNRQPHAVHDSSRLIPSPRNRRTSMCPATTCIAVCWYSSSSAWCMHALQAALLPAGRHRAAAGRLRPRALSSPAAAPLHILPAPC